MRSSRPWQVPDRPRRDHEVIRAGHQTVKNEVALLIDSRVQGLLNRLSDRAATIHDPTYRPHEPIGGEANDGDLDKSDQRPKHESRELVIPDFPKA